MRSWSVILGDQSSFDHVHVESLKKILGEILVCHTGGLELNWSLEEDWDGVKQNETEVGEDHEEATKKDSRSPRPLRCNTAQNFKLQIQPPMTDQDLT